MHSQRDFLQATADQEQEEEQEEQEEEKQEEEEEEEQEEEKRVSHLITPHCSLLPTLIFAQM